MAKPPKDWPKRPKIYQLQSRQAEVLAEKVSPTQAIVIINPQTKHQRVYFYKHIGGINENQ